MPIETQTIQEFMAQHGSPYVQGNSSNHFVLPDGAVFYGPLDRNGCASMYLPPGPDDDPLDTLRVRKLYHSRFLEQIESHFASIKRLAMSHDPGIPPWNERLFGPMPDTVKDILLHLKKLAGEQRAALEAVQVELDEHPNVKAQREQAERAEQSRQASEQQMQSELNEIDRITL